jgi:hypothetical protein
MNVAKQIIEKFGSQSTLAEMIGKGQSTVQYWVKSGTIPAKWQPVLLQIAKEKSINLTMQDFAESQHEIEILNKAPKATHWGELEIGASNLPCYVLENGERVFSLKGVIVGLFQTEGGNLAEYIKVKAIKPFLPEDLIPSEDGTIPVLIQFDTTGSAFAQYAWGLPVEKFMDICAAYSKAAEDPKIELTETQKRIATKANSFLRACYKIGITALVDEVTGYQYERAADALQFKLKLFLEEDMRKWERTFPNELWAEFGRLTNWSGPLNQRPKWWGKLVNELVYGYLDADVAKWLRENAPKPRHGQNYHQWLSSQFGLKKLLEHIWMLIGMARACTYMGDLKERMAIQFGRQRVQLNLFIPPYGKESRMENSKPHGEKPQLKK